MSRLAIVLVLWAFFQRTRVGLAMRAAAIPRVEPSPRRARLVDAGARVGPRRGPRAVAGILVAPTQGSFDQNLMLPVLIFAFAAAGSAARQPDRQSSAAIVLGVVLNLVGAYIDFFADYGSRGALLILRPAVPAERTLRPDHVSSV